MAARDTARCYSREMSLNHQRRYRFVRSRFIGKLIQDRLSDGLAPHLSGFCQEKKGVLGGSILRRPLILNGASGRT